MAAVDLPCSSGYILRTIGGKVVKFFRKVGVQLHVAGVDDGDGHSKCVECNGEDVEDEEAILDTSFGYKDGGDIEENQDEKVGPDEITSLEQLPRAARQHYH